MIISAKRGLRGWSSSIENHYLYIEPAADMTMSIALPRKRLQQLTTPSSENARTRARACPEHADGRPVAVAVNYASAFGLSSGTLADRFGHKGPQRQYSIVLDRLLSDSGSAC